MKDSLEKNNHYNFQKKIGLPHFYMRYNGELIKVVSQEWKSQRGKGTRKACYYVTDSGKWIYSGLVQKLPPPELIELSRSIKIDTITNGEM